MAVLEELRTMGVGLAIDDFGTGFSSLVQLQRLPVDEIKIDRSFVSAMIASESDAAIVRSTIDLARNLGLTVTAEGVEDDATRRRLAEMGCDLAQGYELCRPLPADRCAQVVRDVPVRARARLPAPCEGQDVRRLALAAAALAAGLAAAPAAFAAPYVVTLADGASVDAVVRDARLPAPKLRYDTALTGFAADLNGPQLERVLADPAVAAVEPDAEVSAMGMQALAPGETVPPGIRRTGGATPALAHAPATTAVAVLDTGVDLANQDLDAVTGVNCVKPGTAAQDDNGHGTNVAGIIAARNTGKGVVGVAPGTRVYAVKVLNNRAVGTLSQFLCGINWVAANAAALNIRVANMSIGGVGLSDGACGTVSGDSEHKAICAAAAAGVTFVVSAGNGGTDFSRTVPAAYPEVLTATAITDTDGLPGALGPASCAKKELDDRTGTYSSYAVTAAAAAHAVAAPGTCVTSAGLGGKASTYTGTSQAAPHVAGAVALCHGSGGLPGPCAGLAPAAVIARVRADATAAMTLATRLPGRPAAPADRQGLRAARHRRAY